MEKLLPHNIEAECGVLGSLIIDPDAIAQVADYLQADDFYRNAHRMIYEVVLRLYEERKPPDFIAICDELERRGHLDEVGGPSYITSLINQVPTSGNIAFYADIVTGRALLRRLIHAAGQIAATAYEGANAQAALEKAEDLIWNIGKRGKREEAASLAAISTAYLSRLEKLYAKPGSIVGVPTGFYVLDKLLGGLQRKDLIVLAARPGMGKTSLALDLAYFAACKQYGVGIYSLEMGKEQLYGRLLSREAEIDSQYLRSGRIADGEWERIVAARVALDELPIYIDDTGGLSTTALRSRARRLCSEKQIDLLIVDYLGLLHATNEQGKRYDNRVQEVTEISQSLKALAKELNIPVLALSQLSRAVETRQDKRPILSDLRDSGSVEQDADIVMFLYRDSVYHPEAPSNYKGHAVPGNYTELNVGKHRNGPLGDVDLYFDAAHTRFTDEVSV